MRIINMDFKPSYVECDCGSAEHTVRITSDVEFQSLYIETCLANHSNFFVRVWEAIKYILGYKSKYGMFDCCVLDSDKVNEFLRYILTHKLQCEKDQTSAVKIKKALKAVELPHIADMKKASKKDK
jgi:hypothetical protein